MKTIKLTDEAWALLNNYKFSNSKKSFSETIFMLDDFIEKASSSEMVFINKFNPKYCVCADCGKLVFK